MLNNFVGLPGNSAQIQIVVDFKNTLSIKLKLSDLTALLLLPQAGLRPAEHKLNVQIILSDDQSYPHVGCYGDKDVMTPNLDQFAAQNHNAE